MSLVYTGPFVGRPAAGSVSAGDQIAVTDIIGGAGMALLYSDLTYWRTYMPLRIGGTGAPGTAFTGSTGDHVAASQVIPGGLMTPTGSLRVEIRCSVANSAGGNKSAIVKLGGTQLGGTPLVVTSQAFGAQFLIQNQNVQNSQKGNGAAAAGLFSPWGDMGANGFSTAAIDTSQDQTLQIITQLSNAADSITLSGWEVWLVN